jgi:hypothetical protein
MNIPEICEAYVRGIVLYGGIAMGIVIMGLLIATMIL